ncbi:MAG TPA: hypothetical protein VJ487_08430 [Alphaproteobacteria bacterium]|nr:hypothetical protein [Alphaproteobacteria bacterium]
MMAQGYRLVHVAGYGVNGVAYYAAIWEKRAGPPWQARHGLTGGQYQQTFNQLSQQGYRIRRVSGYFVAGAPYYAAIWEQRSGPPLQARHGLSGAGYQQFFDRMLAQGYRLDWVSGYQLGDDAHYAAIWEQRSGAPFQARHGMTAPDYQQTFNQMSAQQYRLRHVCGYSVLGLPYFAAIWEQRAGPPWEAHHNMTGAQYQQTFDRLVSGKGYRLTDVSGYDAGGQAVYAAIWEQA